MLKDLSYIEILIMRRLEINVSRAFMLNNIDKGNSTIDFINA